jgi:hypothetical protein
MEIWKDVPGYGGFYEASSLGRIRSKERVVLKRSRNGKKIMSQKYSPRILHGTPTRWGHLALNISIGNIKQTVRGHRLVLLAFKGNCPDGMEGCHNNGNPSDNRPDNLRWDTHLANNQDRRKHGRYACGERHPMAKLSDMDVEEIRRSTESTPALAARFGVNLTYLSGLRNRKTGR